MEINQVSFKSIDEYIALFKRLRDDRLRKAVRGALFFKNVSPAAADMLKITENAQDALRQIAAESYLNAKRVKAFGIDPEAAPTALQFQAV